MLNNDIADFVEALAAIEQDRLVAATNQYAWTNAFNAVRRNNLRIYLSDMRAIGPRALLVGEAPSYRGARLTGVAFTSERILLDGWPRGGPAVLGERRGYAKTGEYGKIWTEQSASIVWSTIALLRPLPLLWNAFPFHPYADIAHSNRLPSKSELELGRPFLRLLLDLFPSVRLVIAVGATAASSLEQLGVSATRVRHPAHGGKPRFVTELTAALVAVGDESVAQ